MTIIIFTTLITGIITYFFSKQIRAYAVILYIITGFIAAFVGSHDANIISLGYVPFGMYLLVMYMGALDKGKFKNQLLSVRGELAIIATILLAPHALGYLEFHLEDIGIFNGTISFYIGILAAVVVAPLTLTSFRFVRSKLGYKKWKKIHYFSYVFYLLVAAHLILIQNDRFWLYIGIFASYTVLKLWTIYSDRRDKKLKKQQIQLKKAST